MMKKKQVEDVLGGEEAWANVDKTDGMLRILLRSQVSSQSHQSHAVPCSGSPRHLVSKWLTILS